MVRTIIFALSNNFFGELAEQQYCVAKQGPWLEVWPQWTPPARPGSENEILDDGSRLFLEVAQRDHNRAKDNTKIA